MADLSDQKKNTGSIFPEAAYDAGGGIERIEPLITPSLLKARYFFGINLVSPITKEKMTDEQLQDFINRGIAHFEIDSKVTVSPVLRRVRLPFDPNLYHSNIWCEIPWKPIQKILRLAICSASYSNTPGENDRYPSGAEIYKLPNEWIDSSYAMRGTIFVNPINPAFSAIGTNTSIAASGATILQFIGLQGWVPAYWTAEVITGFSSEEGNVPVIVNELVGTAAAMLICDNLIPLYRIATQSLSMDGLGQSVNDLTYQLLTQKRQQLQQDYESGCKKIKALTANTMFASNV